jgi:hypothetical protein
VLRALGWYSQPRINFNLGILKNLRYLDLVYGNMNPQAMNFADSATASNSRTPRNRASFEGGLRLSVRALLKERDALHEEVQQLRAAVQLYMEVLRRLEVESPERVA